MTTTAVQDFRFGTAEHRAWLLACADRLDREGDHETAAEARGEAVAERFRPVEPYATTHLPCEDCGRPASIRKMPEDWAFDWWSHKLNGRPCREAIAADKRRSGE